jgi:hypothetical protein
MTTLRRSLVAAVGLIGALLLLATSAPAGAPSCVGPHACTGNTGAVGEGACIGDSACLGNAGKIGKRACQGAQACSENAGLVEESSCHGGGACLENVGRIGKNGCIGPEACAENAGAVAESSCRGVAACGANAGAIGKKACSGDAACQERSGAVGESACVGPEACALSGPGAIGKKACQGDRACEGRTGAVGESACIGSEACALSGPGEIGKNACRGERACRNNLGPIAKDKCNGPPDATGKGVCEIPFIAFTPGGTIDVKRGSIQHVVLALQGAARLSGASVRLSVSDSGILGVTPAACTLSGSSESSSRCTLTLRGKATGRAVIAAQATGYGQASLSATVGDATTYGSLVVADEVGTFVGQGPITIAFKATGPTPYQKTLKAQIAGSSGIVESTGALINFSSPSATVSFNPAQCQVTSAAPECDTVMSNTAATAATVTVQVVGAVLSEYSGYVPITVNASPNTTPMYGRIAVSTQSGNNVPQGMKAPLFVNWLEASESDSVTVTLTIAGSGIEFYGFDPGDNTAMRTATTASCTLTYGGSGNAPSCGFGLVGQASSGTVTINASATATSGHTYTIAPLTLGAVAPEPPARAITFTNTSVQTVYVGITGGAANAYVSPTASAVPAGTPSADVKPGAGSLCGPSNPQAACPIGSTCLQGGAKPNSDIGTTPFYCYYDQPVPSSGYALAAGGGATTINISASSLSPGGIIWSGNFYGRTGCDATTGQCANATCAGAAGGLACGPGTGPTPGINTLAETTFQATPNPDYYDVSIINGVNFAAQFGPTNVAVSASDAYLCGVAGSTSAQNGGYPTNPTAGLPAASWALRPTSASFPPGASITGDPASYFTLVIPSAAASSCTGSSACTTPPDLTCGYRMSDVTGGSFTFDSSQRYCGQPVAYLTADAIWGSNPSSGNAAPFSFNTTFDWTNPNSSTNPSGTVSVGDLQLCIDNTYSGYIDNGTTGSTPPFPVQPIALACGGVEWGATESPGPLQNPAGNVGLNLTRPSQPVQTANANWLTYVLPTILWLKQACPTCYTYPFDDMTSTFTCVDNSGNASTNYGVAFSDPQ